MRIQFKNRWTGAVIYEGEFESFLLAVEEAVAKKIDLRGANLRGANLSDANLSGAYLSDACLSDAYLSGANLRGANLRGAYLRGANLSGAYLSGANLSGANLSDAYLSGAYLSDAYLSGANLSGANLRDANLRDANLRGANLRGAYLSGANLSDANLSGAYLSDANLSGARGLEPWRTTPLMLLLDQPGPIRLYKLVNERGEGPFSGGLVYSPGATLECPDANTDPLVDCGAGINVATLDWCLREWREGYRVLIVEFTAEDIAAIPLGTDGKIRLHRCNVIDWKDISGLVTTPAKEAP